MDTLQNYRPGYSKQGFSLNVACPGKAHLSQEIHGLLVCCRQCHHHLWQNWWKNTSKGVLVSACVHTYQVLAQALLLCYWNLHSTLNHLHFMMHETLVSSPSTLYSYSNNNYYFYYFGFYDYTYYSKIHCLCCFVPMCFPHYFIGLLEIVFC